LRSGAIIGSKAQRYLPGTAAARQRASRLREEEKEETAMRKTILTALGAALITVSLATIASASERHHARKVEQFRNANNAVVIVQPNEPQTYYTGGWSAPAGR
jgi:hypothetical protein